MDFCRGCGSLKVKLQNFLETASTAKAAQSTHNSEQKLPELVVVMV